LFHSLFPLIVAIVILLVTTAIIKTVLGQKKRAPQNYPYEKAQALFSPAERSLLGVLEDRDQFVDNTLKSTGIPVVHVTAKKSYSMQDIPNILAEAGLQTKT
jgi:flagellar basal body-associated protein FliL